MIGLAEIAGPIACIGLAVLLLARTRRNRIAGLCYAGVGSVLLAVSLAPTNAAEIGAAVGGVIVLGPLLAWLFRREPWLVAFATLAFVPLRIGFLGHSLLVPLYAVALGAAGLLLWQLVEGDDRTRELGIVSWPLALYLLWIGFSVGWSVDVHSAAIDLLAFYVPFTILAVSIARLPWRASRVRILYGELVAMALVFAVVGFYQYETKTIFQNAKLHQSNIYQALFRVNSVFFDPSIYGRFLVVALIATAVLIVRSRAVAPGRPGRAGIHRRRVARAAHLLLAVELRGVARRRVRVDRHRLALEVALRARGRPRRRGRDRRGPAAPDACAAPPHDLGPQPRHERPGDSDRGRDQDRRGRTRRTASASAASSTRTRNDEGRKPKQSASHNTPVTVAAEEGGPGLIIFFWLVGALLLAAYRRIKHGTYGRVALAAGLALLAIFVHSLAYNDFFEDPTTWGLIGLVGLVSPLRVRARAPARVEPAEPVPEMIAR